MSMYAVGGNPNLAVDAADELHVAIPPTVSLQRVTKASINDDVSL